MKARVEALINPKLLVWGRETAGLTIEVAAHKLGVKPERLKAWEAGELRPTITQLRKAAAAYKRPLIAFYLPEPPTTFRVPHDYRTIRDEAKLQLSPALLSEIRRIHFQRDVAVELAEHPEDTEFAFLGTETALAPIEETAARARRALGVTVAQQLEWASTPNGPFNGWRAALESLNVLVFQFENVEVEEVRGISFSHGKFPVIAVNGKDSPAPRVFSLIHEFGHLLLNTQGICSFDESRQDQQLERFCNEFAAAVLIPEERLKEALGLPEKPRMRDWTPDELRQTAEFFGVSTQVIHRRLVSLRYSNIELHIAILEMLKKQVEESVQRKEKKGGPPPSYLAVRRVGPTFSRIVFDAYDRDEITTGDITEYFGVRAKHLDQIRHLAFTTYTEEIAG